MNDKLENYIVFVTGIRGFLGLNLINALLKQGAEVIGLSLGYINENDIPNNIIKNEKFHFCKNEKNIKNLLNKYNLNNFQSAFCHFAGISNANYCQNHPFEAYSSNVRLTIRVLEFCKEYGVSKFIYPSTGYVYGNELDMPASENNQLVSDNIYTASKISAESLIQSYSKKYELVSVVCRISNVFGDGISSQTVTGKIIDCVKKNDKIRLRTLKPIRDFIYIDDVINSFLLLIISENKINYNCYNLSTGRPISIKDLATIACEVFSISKDNIIIDKTRNYPDSYLVLDNEKFKKTFNWIPMFDLKSGMLKIRG